MAASPAFRVGHQSTWRRARVQQTASRTCAFYTLLSLLTPISVACGSPASSPTPTGTSQNPGPNLAEAPDTTPPPSVAAFGRVFCDLAAAGHCTYGRWEEAAQALPTEVPDWLLAGRYTTSDRNGLQSLAGVRFETRPGRGPRVLEFEIRDFGNPSHPHFGVPTHLSEYPGSSSWRVPWPCAPERRNDLSSREYTTYFQDGTDGWAAVLQQDVELTVQLRCSTLVVRAIGLASHDEIFQFLTSIDLAAWRVYATPIDEHPIRSE